MGVEVVLIKTKVMNKSFYIQDSFIYVVDRIIGTKAYLKCRRHPKCKGRGLSTVIRIRNGGSHELRNIKITKVHNHAPSQSEITSLKMKRSCLIRSAEEPVKFIDLYREELSRHRSSSIAFPAMRKCMERSRKIDRPNVPRSIQEFDERIRRCPRLNRDSENKIFYLETLYGRDGESSIFLNKDFEILLKRGCEVAIDGTFKCVPNIFKQMISLHVRYHNYMFPILEVLTSSKTQRTYLEIFNYIVEKYPLFQPSKIMVDFERALGNALSITFPEAEIRGCHFHFANAVIRRTKRDFRGQLTDESRILLRRILALPLLHHEHIEQALDLLFEINNDPQLNFLNDYLKNTWCGVIGVRMMSVAGLAHRTNNDVESFHSQLNNSVDRHNPNAWDFIGKLRDFNLKYVNDFKLLGRGQKIRKSSKRAYKIINRQLSDLYDEMPDDPDDDDLLYFLGYAGHLFGENLLQLNFPANNNNYGEAEVEENRESSSSSDSSGEEGPNNDAPTGTSRASSPSDSSEEEGPNNDALTGTSRASSPSDSSGEEGPNNDPPSSTSRASSPSDSSGEEGPNYDAPTGTSRTSSPSDSSGEEGPNNDAPTGTSRASRPSDSSGEGLNNYAPTGTSRASSQSDSSGEEGLNNAAPSGTSRASSQSDSSGEEGPNNDPPSGTSRASANIRDSISGNENLRSGVEIENYDILSAKKRKRALKTKRKREEKRQKKRCIGIVEILQQAEEVDEAIIAKRRKAIQKSRRRRQRRKLIRVEPPIAIDNDLQVLPSTSRSDETMPNITSPDVAQHNSEVIYISDSSGDDHMQGNSGTQAPTNQSTMLDINSNIHLMDIIEISDDSEDEENNQIPTNRHGRSLSYISSNTMISTYVKRINKHQVGHAMCPICLTPYIDGKTKIRTMRCFHFGCDNCVINHLQIRGECFSCRTYV